MSDTAKHQLINIADRLDQIIPTAKLIGGSRLVRIVCALADDNAKIPMSEETAKRYREVGDKAIAELTQLGIILDYKRPHVDLDGLGGRAKARLRGSGFVNKESVIRAIKSGDLKPLKGCGYGWVTHAEVCEWAGLPKPVKTKRVPICPHCSKVIPAPLEYQIVECDE